MTLYIPRDEAEAAGILAEAALRKTPLALLGNGTKAAIGRPAQAEASLSAAGLTGLTLHEPAELVVAARAGTPLAEVEAALAAKGQHLSFEPLDYRPLLGSRGEPTIGAVAAGNLSGPRRIQAGAARDSLIGLRFVNGRGEVLRSGGRVMKNVTGLDLVKLLAGSWGTLGFLTEVTFKVLPCPERSATLVLRGLADERAMAALAAGLGSPFDVTGAAHLPAAAGEPARTLLRLEGFSTSIAYRVSELGRRLKGFGAAEPLEGEASASLWRGIRDAAPLVEPRDHAVWRVSTAPSRGPAIARAAAPLGARWFYDWGGGLVWIAVPPEGDAGAGAIRGALRAAGGHATLVRAPDALRAQIDPFEPQPDATLRLTRDVKASLDPAGVLNPGRMYAGV